MNNKKIKIMVLIFFSLLSLILLSIIIIELKNSRGTLIKVYNPTFELEDANDDLIGGTVDYSSKVNIGAYSSATNQYIAPSNGYILVPSFATRDVGIFRVYENDEQIACNISSGNWVRDSLCIPISQGTNVYYLLSGTTSFDGNIFFVPNV